MFSYFLKTLDTLINENLNWHSNEMHFDSLFESFRLQIKKLTALSLSLFLAEKDMRRECNCAVD